MSRLHRWQIVGMGCMTALVLAACGGGGNGTSSPPVTQSPDAPAMTNDIATDGRNWINYRRSQIGIPALTRNTVIDIAAKGHSEYQKINNEVTHEQTPGKPGFTGTGLLDRLTAAGYQFTNTNHAYGEVISATTNKSGFYMAEELITAIYHRFVIFEPVFKEIGTGAATTSANYTYFTSDFAANNGYGPGIASGTVATWPYSGQTQVAPNFFSDYEAPDPVPEANEVGYPVSVHANINTTLTVQTFSMRPRGGTDLQVKLLSKPVDAETPRSAAAIVPMAVLKGGTTYDVTFVGSVDGTPVNRSWSFTTK